MMPGLLSFLGIDEDKLEGNGIVDGKTRLREGDVTPAELVSSGAATPEAATLLNGLFGQVMKMEAPTDPGKTFNDYLGDQGGFKGFMGDVVGEPILNSLFFGKDEDAYDQLKSDYGVNKKRYDSLFEIATAGEVQRAKNDAPDAQNTAVYDYMQDVIAGNVEFNQMHYNALVGNAAGYDKVDVNDYTVGQGQQRRSGFDNSVVAHNPKDDPLTTQERNLAARNELYAQEPQDKNSPEWQAWDQKRQFFESSVRANLNIGGTLYSGTGSGVVGGDRREYVDNTTDQTEAERNAANTANYRSTAFDEASKTYRTAWEQKDMIDERIANVDMAIEMFDPNNPNALDTGPIRGGIYKIFGIGPEGMATIDAMNVEETINWLMNFKGPTTDFEFDKSSAAAFADIMKGGEVNLEKLGHVRRTLEKVARLNLQKGEAAYGTLQDYRGEEGKSGDRSQDVASITKNYAPWFEPKGSQEGMIDGVPTFARFSADMEKRAKDSGTEMSAADIRALYNQYYPTPRK